MPGYPKPLARLSSTPLPPYTYIPGQTPHPISDPRGHMYGHAPSEVKSLDPARWQDSEPYRYALDLFNHGFYWEAHEAWESLWHAAGRAGATAIWLKSLIKLAAAGVKRAEGNLAGAQRHIARTLELKQELQQSLSAECQSYAGIGFSDFDQAARDLASDVKPQLTPS